MTAPAPITPALLDQAKRELAIDPASPSGLRWAISKRGVIGGIGAVAGSRRRNGYWFVGIARRRIHTGRLVLLLSGCETEDPRDEVDHIDGNPGNNAIENLRWSLDNADQNLNRRYKTKTGYRWVHKQARHDSYFFQFVIPCSSPPQYVRRCGFTSPKAAYEHAVTIRREMGLSIFTR